ncbi:hypothetical protein LCUFL03_160013 [Latilactobacillus curvatus]|nr:hypothetical protein LCUFL03_160013 [Latilactobacillus curvatus]
MESLFSERLWSFCVRTENMVYLGKLISTYHCSIKYYLKTLINWSNHGVTSSVKRRLTLFKREDI